MATLSGVNEEDKEPPISSGEVREKNFPMEELLVYRGA
jgi:hypothetical protein